MDRVKSFLFEDSDDWMGARALKFLLDHPPYLLTLLYLGLSGLGLLFEIAIFARYRIDVLDYSEPADFFLAAFKRPRALLAVVIVSGAMLSYRLVATHVKRYRGRGFGYLLSIVFFAGWLRREILILITMALIVVSYLVAAFIEAHRLVFREDTIVTIMMRGADAREIRLVPIGSTGSFLFGIEYDAALAAKRQADDRGTIVPAVQAVPVSNIATITYRAAPFSRLTDR